MQRASGSRSSAARLCVRPWFCACRDGETYCKPLRRQQDPVASGDSPDATGRDREVPANMGVADGGRSSGPLWWRLTQRDRLRQTQNEAGAGRGRQSYRRPAAPRLLNRGIGNPRFISVHSRSIGDRALASQLGGHVPPVYSPSSEY